MTDIPQWNDGTKPSPAPWKIVRSETPYYSWIMAADGSCVCLGFGERDEAILLAAQPAPEPPERDDECAHCWHGTGQALLSVPPKYPQVCCHCGAARYYTPPPPTVHDMSIPLPCGPHAPTTHYHHVFFAAPPSVPCSCSDGCDGVRGSASCVAGKP